jgi:nucleoid-associated protein YgaU
MILGAIVIVVAGVLAINFFKSRSGGETVPAIDDNSAENITLPTTHTVEEGEDLWKIAEIYYKSGYNWADIAKENNITNPNLIAAGTKLTIPNVTPKLIGEALASPTPTQTPEKIEGPVSSISSEKLEITDSTYTVVSGDTLWDIAVRAYGDGYKWGELAKANKLQNPNLIHAGNVFVIPR